LLGPRGIFFNKKISVLSRDIRSPKNPIYIGKVKDGREREDF